MSNVNIAIAALLLVANAGCGDDAIPAAQADSPSANFYYEMSGARIPASAKDGQVYEYY
jgi:hypothetical protein